MADNKRDSRGRFRRSICAHTHDRCYLGGPCPWCELAPIKDKDQS